MPDDLFDLGPLRWPISRPACVGLPPFMPYHAVCLATSLDHKQWIPETESLEAVSDKPFNEWVDITGVREFIHHEISSIGTRKVTIEACRVKGERNIRLMAFVLKKDNPWILSIYELSHSLARISGRLSSMGIDDVKVEVWETDFHLMVV
uniref:WGS project CBMI000000000 data, contig CS3069_c004832 n=1 Tax=Fusarium clavum TaxID=2594811 RepID=A0A090N649_9HYPO|nr:unnamed protein product [Fusarium clavum]